MTRWLLSTLLFTVLYGIFYGILYVIFELIEKKMVVNSELLSCQNVSGKVKI